MRTKNKKAASKQDAAADSGGPLYDRVARQLRADIVGGVYPVGERLPTVEELAERFDVSRHTMREALRMLREENLVASRKKAGTVVVPPRTTQANFQHLMSLDDLLAFSHRWHFAIDEIVMRKLDPELAKWIGVGSDERWLAASGVAHSNGGQLPECWTTYYINPRFSTIGRLLEENAGRVLPLIEKMFGVRITRLTQEISAVILSTVLAERLAAQPGTAAITVRRSYQASDGLVALITAEIYPAARFRYTATLDRERDQVRR